MGQPTENMLNHVRFRHSSLDSGKVFAWQLCIGTIRDWSTKSGDSVRDENIYGLRVVLKFELSYKSSLRKPLKYTVPIK